MKKKLKSTNGKKSIKVKNTVKRKKLVNKKTISKKKKNISGKNVVSKKKTLKKKKKTVKNILKKTIRKKGKKNVKKSVKKKVYSKKKIIRTKKVKRAAYSKKESSDRTLALTPMRIYLNQIEDIPLLTAEEELTLAEIIQERKRGWKKAREKMIRSNLRLVINISKRYMNLGLSFSDLVEEGNIGLMRAVDKFNYKKGYRFSTYASWWIKQSLMRALSNQGKLIRIPVHMFEIMNKYRKVREYLIHKKGKIPTDVEIAKLMKIKVKKINEIRQVAITSSSSLNAPVSLDGNAELIDLIEDGSLEMPHEKLQDSLKYGHIERFLGYLSAREKTILIMRFGLYEGDTHTLEDTARCFNITRERVRQIEEAALRKIRKQLQDNNDKLEHYI